MNSSPDNQQLILEQRENSVRKFRILTVIGSLFKSKTLDIILDNCKLNKWATSSPGSLTSPSSWWLFCSVEQNGLCNSSKGH